MSNKINAHKNRLILILGQLSIITICVLYLFYLYHYHVLPDRIARNTYKKTLCYIVSKKLSTKGIVIRRFRANFLITYAVNGVLYKLWVSGNGLDKDYLRNQHGPEDILAQYELGGSYPCWYDPKDPTKVLLVFRQEWLSLIYLVIPVGVIILLFAFLLVKSLPSIIEPSKRKLTPQKKQGKRVK